MNFFKTQREVHMLPNHDPQILSIYHFESGVEGPLVTVVANVHGAELQGDAILYQLAMTLTKFPLKRGKLKLIPMANPQALKTQIGTHVQGRFSLMTGENYNRNYIDLVNLNEEEGGFSIKNFCFQTKDLTSSEQNQRFKETLDRSLDRYFTRRTRYGGLENEINFWIQKETIFSDYVIDLHTGPDACRYMYTAEYALKSALEFSFPHMIVIPDLFAGALDEASFMPWVSLHKENLRRSKESKHIPALQFEAYTLEFGSEDRVCLEEASSDCLQLLQYLHSKKMIGSIEKPSSKPLYKTDLKNFKSYYASTGGIFIKMLQPGDHFKKGDVLAKIFHFKVTEFNSKSIEKNSFTFAYAIKDGILINYKTGGLVERGQMICQVIEEVIDMKEFTLQN